MLKPIMLILRQMLVDLELVKTRSDSKTKAVVMQDIEVINDLLAAIEKEIQRHEMED
jgi:hypothetical protein